MKLNKFLWGLGLFAALGFVASCSDDDAITENKVTGFDANGSGYICINLNLPTQNGETRAATQDNNDAVVFDDGDENDYKVNNATLLLFTGKTEAEATFHSAYDLTKTFIADNSTDQVTNRVTKAFKVKNPFNTNAPTFAYVILNHNGHLQIQPDGNLFVEGQKMLATQKFTDMTATVLDGGVGNFTANGIMMTNAVLTEAEASSSHDNTVVCLATLDPSKVYISAEAAEATGAEVAADIYVERAVAKVQVGQTSGTKTLKVDDIDLTWNVTKWTLANTNAKTYLGRQWQASSESNPWLTLTTTSTLVAYRFGGSAKIDNNALYRTYWGKDANYDGKDENGSALTYPIFADYDHATTKWTATDGTALCLENTFDVLHMDIRNTTCAIIEVQFKTGTAGHLYQMNGKLYTGASLNALVATWIKASVDADTWTAMTTGLSGTITADISFSTPDETGKVSISTLTLKDDASHTSSYNFSGTIAAANAAMTVYQFTDGKAYYKVPIRHFNDNQTPWNSTDKGPEITATYPGTDAVRASNYLGRYGVLRNNWYGITVNSVTAIGSAVPPTVNEDDTPDDNVEQYIAARISVLSWAKRTQNVELK